jgi:predicted flap endonuclease-1-like 5' DNA nuclease
MLDRSVKSFFAVTLLVTGLLILTNLLIDAQTLEDSSWIAAFVVLGLSAFFFIWMWLDTRERTEPMERVSGTGALRLPQSYTQEWEVPRQMAASTTDVAPSGRVSPEQSKPGAEESPLPFEEVSGLAESSSGKTFVEGVVAPSTGLEPAVEPHEVDEAPNLPGELATPATSPYVEATSDIMDASEHKGNTEDKSAQPKLATQPQPEAMAAEEPNDAEASSTTRAPESKMVDLTTGAVDPTEHREEQFVKVTPDEGTTTLNEAKDQVVDSTVTGGEAPIVEEAKAGDVIAQEEIAEDMSAAPEKRDTALDAGDAVGQVTEPVAVDTSVADDLTVIEGIGPKFNAALNAAGIITYNQLANTTPEQIQELLRNAGYGRVPSTYDTWAEQAGYLARGDRGGFDNYVKTLVAGRRRPSEEQ